MKTVHPWEAEKRAVTRTDDAHRARLREEERLFAEQMEGHGDRFTRDQRSHHGDFYALLDHESWSLGNQLEHGARLTPHRP